MDIEIMRAESKLIDKIISSVKIAAKHDEYKLPGLLDAVKCIGIWAPDILPETVEALRNLESTYNTRLMQMPKSFVSALENGSYVKMREYQTKEEDNEYISD